MNIQGELASLQRINDRLTSTSNEDLEKVLETLLPKLLPLSNNEDLRDKQVVPILMHVLRRTKLLETRLPLQALISLIRPDMMPFCCNLTMVFIDAAKKWHSAELWRDCAQPLIAALGGFTAFTSQSNALCYYSLPCLRYMSAQMMPTTENTTVDILGDWLLDLALAQPGIVKDSAGSIQPGLSSERLGRFTAKKTEWSALDMKQYKIDLVESLSKQWLPTPCAVAIAIISSCDTETDVLTQATFKMSGARSILPDINVNPLPVLELLLTLCLPLTQAMLKNHRSLFVRQRTTLRTSVKCAILRWICKEMQDHLIVAAKNIVQLVITEMMKSSEMGITDVAYSSHIMELTALLVERLPDESLQTVASVLLQCAKKALRPFISLLSSNSASSVDSEAGISTRECCYRAIDRISRSCPAVAVADAELLVLLFRLLDCEDNQAVIRLYTALGGLRMAYQSSASTDADPDQDGKEISPTRITDNSVISKGIGREALAELISRSRTSSEPKKRLAAVQWARALFFWNPLVLETMILLADDPNESVAQAVATEFISLRLVIAEQISVDSNGSNPVDINGDTSASSMSGSPLGDVLELLESPLLFFPKTWIPTNKHKAPSDTSNISSNVATESEPRLRPIASEELLHTAAVGMRRLVSTTRHYHFDEQFFLRSDPWPVIAQISDSSQVQSGAINITENQLCAIMTAIGEILSSTSISKNKSTDSSAVATGAVRSKIALEAALQATQSRNILAAAVDLLHKCLLFSCKSTVLDCAKKLLPHMLTSLSVCYSDPLDPFGLISPSAGQLSANMNKPTQSPPSANKDILGGGRSVGCLRVHLGQVIALSCQNVDENSMSNLVRILDHKLSKVPTHSNTNNVQTKSTAASLVEGDLLLLAGATTAMGSIVEALAAWSSTSGRGNTLRAVCVCNQLLDTISGILDLSSGPSEPSQSTSTASIAPVPREGNAKESPVPRDPSAELKVVALRVLKGVAASGLMQSVSNASTALPKSAPMDTATPDTPQVSSDKISKILNSMINLVKGYAAREAAGVSNGTSNGRSKASSKIVAAAIDVLSTACLAGVTEGFFWVVWELLLSLQLSRTETPLLRFALAEGLVRMSAVPTLSPTSPTPMSTSTISQASISTEDPQTEENLPVLTRVLLGIIETAVAGGPPVSLRTGGTSQQPSGGAGVGSGRIFDKSTAGVLLLVLVKQAVHSLPFNPSAMGAEDRVPPTLQTLPEKEVLRATELFLQLLREKDAFLQDMSCAGMCYLFNFACHFDKQLTTSSKCLMELESNLNDKSLSVVVGREVIATLTREKRGPQSAGVAVAGESTSSSSEGDMARALEAVMNPAAVEEGEDERRGGAGNRGGGGGGGGGGAVAGGGGGVPAPVDPLAAATAAAAMELGLSPEATAALTRYGARQVDNSDNGFGVYTTACKVAKKTGDPSVVFAVLALIQRDPSFGVGETSTLRFIYQAPIAHIDKKKIRDLLPSLFLAKYDPSPPVKALMRQLWETLITAQGLQKLLSTLQNEVIKYLCISLSSKQWREREAACSALEAFLPLRPWGVVRAKGEDLWNTGMSVLDDVRDSTRVAAVGLMKVLSDQVLRACSPEESGSSAAVVDDAVSFIMPILLDKGLLAPSQEGRGFTLGVLVKLIKSSRSSLKEWLVRLVAVLVESMSALEPKTLQYMQFHTARLQINDEELENMRVRLSRQSPMQEALDACLQALGGRPQDVPEAARALRTQLQSGVGLATRVAAVQSLAYLADTLPGELGATEHGSKAFRTVVDSLINSPQMAVALKKALLGGLGSLAKVVNADVLATVCEELISRYEALGRDDSAEGPVIASCLLQLVTRSGDRLLDDCAWSRLLACTYIGTSDTNPEAQEVWTKLWPEVLSGSATGTKAAALLRVLPIIVRLVCALLADLAWNKRKQAVAVIADLAVSLSSKQLSPCVGGIVEALLRSIPGQIWSGQAVALETLSAIVGKCFLTGNVEFSGSKDDLMVTRYVRSGAKGESEAASSVPATGVSGSLDLIVFSLEDAIVKKSSVLPGTTTEQLDTAAMALSIEISQASHPLSAHSPNRNHDSDSIWMISLRGLLTLLLHETRRGDREYRLSGAKALSALPWGAISSIPEARAVFAEYVAEFARLGGVSPPVTRAAGIGEVTVSDPAAAGGGEKAYLKGDRRKKQQTNSAMFGSRYGIDFKEKKSNVVMRRVPASHPVLLSSVAPTDAPADDVGVESIVDAVDMSEDTDNNDHANNLNDESGVEVVLIAQDDSTDGDLSRVDRTTEDIPAVLAVSTGMYSPDPAFRVKMMDCISLGWPLEIPGSNSNNATSLIVNNTNILWSQYQALGVVKVADLVSWAAGVMDSGEVWSVRVAALQVLGAVLSVWHAAENREDSSITEASGVDLFLSAVRTITQAMADKKHSKVRIASLLCLNKILSGGESRAFLFEREEVRVVLRTAASDSEPAVLEAASKAQKNWLALSLIQESVPMTMA